MIPKKVAGQAVPPNGVMFVGSEGQLYADYSRYRLFPSEKFAKFSPPLRPSLNPSAITLNGSKPARMVRRRPATLIIPGAL